jgi:antitoxin VapB
MDAGMSQFARRFYNMHRKVESAMPLSIKNEEAEKLARELARETGDTLTGAIVQALREALLRVRGRRTSPSVRDALLEISERCAALPDQDRRTPDEILGYDDEGGFG